MTMLDHLKPIAAITAAGVIWIADTVAAGIETMPGWISEIGLPSAFCLICLYAIRVLYLNNQNLNKELTQRASEQAALLTESTDALKNAASQYGQLTAATERNTAVLNSIQLHIASTSNHKTHRTP
jgi:hypothetical protein